METKSPYKKIAENIAGNPLIAPMTDNGFSKALIKYLQLVYTPEEALLAQYLKMHPRFRTAGRVAEMSGKDVEHVKKVLAVVHRKGCIVRRKKEYALPATGLLIHLFQVDPEFRGKTFWNNTHAILQTSFVPRTAEHCIFCGACVDICPVEAMSLNTKKKRAEADPEKCMGCGACAIECMENALQLIPYERTIPLKSMEALLKTLVREKKR